MWTKFMYTPFWEVPTTNNAKFNYNSEYNDGKTHYTITSDGKTTIVKDVKSGIEGVSKCHPEDKFDLQKGIDLALERMKEAVEQKMLEERKVKIEDGCYAVIVDNGGCFAVNYAFAKKWFTLNECIRYAYNYIPSNGTKVRVNRIIRGMAIIEYIPQGREDTEAEVVGIIRPNCLKRIAQ